ncbi:hypothetical protein B0H14DRAFT_3704402 [Mycena olivaceomarginata]|nr:hypothetical protein B0H14DRAFT_3704402 [Mycena olivaceomarginata]
MADPNDPIDIEDDDEDITPMESVRKLVKEKPELGKWFVSSPALMKQQEKARQANERKKKKRKDRNTEEDDEENDDPEPVKKKGKKKVKPLDDDEPLFLTCYVRKNRRPRLSMSPVDRSSFLRTATLNTSSPSLLTPLPCPATHIILDKTEWKPQTPANRLPLPLGGQVGFDVLQEQISLTKDKTVIIIMPGPRKPADDAPFWDTGTDGGGSEAGPSIAPAAAKKEFDFTELEVTNVEESVAQQKVSFDQNVAPYVDELKERWPVNEAGKRIYTDENGYMWDLSTLRLSVWGAHMARGTATLDKPPVSAQFDIRYRLKAQPVAAIPAPVPAPHIPAPVAAPSATDQLLAMALSMLQQQQQ